MPEKTRLNLVTGATGHIGNVLVRQLLARGERVRVLLRPGKVPLALEDLGVARFPGDLLDAASLGWAVQGVDVVYHLGARIDLAGDEDDQEMEAVNVGGTRRLLEAAFQHGVGRFVYASSIYALRPLAEGVVDESLPYDPSAARGAYDRSKAAASLLVQEAAARGLETVLLCPTAVTGPFDFQVSDAGRGIRYNMRPGIKFTVDGGYDFVDVRDVARGFLLAAEKGQPGETYILGGERLTVRQVSQIIWEAADGWHTGLHLPDWVADLGAEVLPFFSDHPIVSPYALGAIRSNSHISHEKATRELGYQPRPARRAVLDAVRWWQERESNELSLPETFASAFR